MPPPDANPSYILPSYFAKYHDSPHKWDEIAYLEHTFPEGVQITSSQYQKALNRWVGAIKWLKENSEHVEPANKLLEQHSDEVYPYSLLMFSRPATYHTTSAGTQTNYMLVCCSNYRLAEPALGHR